MVGRIGATESPPWDTVLVSGRTLTGPASEPPEADEEFETFLIGEKVDIADPGRASKFLLAIAAFF